MVHAEGSATVSWSVDALASVAAVSRPVVYVCRGGDCTKRKAERKALVRAVGRRADVVEVRCQSICRGPVAGVEVEGRIEWFQRLRKPRSQRALAELAASGGSLAELPGRLAKRWVAKRSGRRR
jgi:hypothetical protein